MKRNFIFLFISVIYLGACSKSSSEIKTVASESQAQQTDLVTAKGVTYFIPQGAHYCIPNPLTFTSQSVLSFKAVFDSSCIYTTTDPLNQYDINKLYGFSDCNDQHLTNSVRIGWRWSNDSLRIFSFVHNQGVMLMNEITTAKIGAVVRCRITCLINT